MVFKTKAGTEMLNVLHLIHYLGNGGSEKYICSLAEKLHNRLCNFTIAYCVEGHGEEPFQELGIDLIRMEMNSPIDIRAARMLKRLCEQRSIDVIHTHFLRENYIGILSKILGNKVKIINTRHMLFENSKLVIWANRLICRLDDKIIAVSGHVREQLLREGILPEKVELIYTGIDLKQWNTPASGSFRKEFGIAEDEILVTSAARFSAEKGHDFFIDAVKYFKEQVRDNRISIPKLRFILAGEGELLDSITGKVKTYGLDADIIFTGYRRDMKNILESSDVFISHSSSESFGISILEAMAAGLPIISTDSGGTREIVIDRLKSGILIDYGDTKAFSDALISLLTNKDLRNSFVSNGRHVVEKYFNLDKTAEETYNLYVLS